MTIGAKIIKDSISPYGIRLTTMQCRYPKFIHGEAKTHRVMKVGTKLYDFYEEVGFMDEDAFSRNASSSRAIPVERMIQDVLDDPAMPVFWGKNKPGMQAVEELIGGEKEAAIAKWLKARDDAVANARLLAGSGVHKQIVNRLIETWVNINTLTSSTEWANFYALRRHLDAQPEMKALADAMWEAQQASTPTLLQPGEWHLPYVLEEEIEVHGGLTDPTGVLRKISTARNARTSYLTHDARKPNIQEDLALCERLIGSVPLHSSPAEHVSTPDKRKVYYSYEAWIGSGWHKVEQHGNFVGWIQYRKTLPNESIKDR